MEEKPKLSAEETKKLMHENLKELPSEDKPLLKEESKKEEKETKKEMEETKKEEEKKELENTLIRLQAEFDNYRKRTQKELAECVELGKMEFARSQLSFLDELENAQSYFTGEHAKGIEMLLSNFKKTLSAHGVREMEVLGKKYDPYLHEVVAQQESEEPEGTIIGVVRKGYMFKDKVLRHAQVLIAKKPEKKVNEDEQKDRAHKNA